MKHLHEWHEVARRHTPRTHHLTQTKNIAVDDLLKIINGFTSVELRCPCGDMKFVTQPGDQT